MAGRWNPGTSPAAGGRVVYHQAECGGKRGEADDEGEEKEEGERERERKGSEDLRKDCGLI